MCKIEQILCGLPKNGVAEHYIRYSAVMLYISFAILIMAEFASLFTHEFAYQVVGSVGTIIFMIVWLRVSLLLVWTIANLNARIIQLEAGDMVVETEL